MESKGSDVEKPVAGHEIPVQSDVLVIQAESIRAPSGPISDSGGCIDQPCACFNLPLQKACICVGVFGAVLGSISMAIFGIVFTVFPNIVFAGGKPMDLGSDFAKKYGKAIEEIQILGGVYAIRSGLEITISIILIKGAQRKVLKKCFMWMIVKTFTLVCTLIITAFTGEHLANLYAIALAPSLTFIFDLYFLFVVSAFCKEISIETHVDILNQLQHIRD